MGKVHASGRQERRGQVGKAASRMSRTSTLPGTQAGSVKKSATACAPQRVRAAQRLRRWFGLCREENGSHKV